jgi:hypothetical protein
VISEEGFVSYGMLNNIYRLVVTVRNLALHKESKDFTGKVLKLTSETR